MKLKASIIQLDNILVYTICNLTKDFKEYIDPSGYRIALVDSETTITPNELLINFKDYNPSSRAVAETKHFATVVDAGMAKQRAKHAIKAYNEAMKLKGAK